MFFSSQKHTLLSLLKSNFSYALRVITESSTKYVLQVKGQFIIQRKLRRKVDIMRNRGHRVIYVRRATLSGSTCEITDYRLQSKILMHTRTERERKFLVKVSHFQCKSLFSIKLHYGNSFRVVVLMLHTRTDTERERERE